MTRHIAAAFLKNLGYLLVFAGAALALSGFLG